MGTTQYYEEKQKISTNKSLEESQVKALHQSLWMRYIHSEDRPENRMNVNNLKSGMIQVVGNNKN